MYACIKKRGMYHVYTTYTGRCRKEHQASLTVYGTVNVLGMLISHVEAILKLNKKRKIFTNKVTLDLD